MPSLNFDDILNKEKGKVGLVCGSGGSLREYHELFERLSKTQKDKYCCIAANQWHQKTNLDVDYWVVANSVYTVAKEYNTFNSKNSTLIYADSVDKTDRNFVESNLKIDYLAYDERHQGGNPCQRQSACCNNIIPGRKTIQEYLKNITSYNKIYNSCGTVGIHMIAVAVILGCNPIYVSGIDMNYNTGYVDGSTTKNMHGNISLFSSNFGIQTKIIVESAKNLGIEIVQLSSLAKYDGIEKGKFKEI